MASFRKKATTLRHLFAHALLAPALVGGQAVIEGVMMRNAALMAVVVRGADGKLANRIEPWRSITSRVPLLRLPLLRGSAILVESLVNGIHALNYSATKAAEAARLEDGGEQGLSRWTMAATMAFSLLLGLGIFVVLPHVLSAALLRIFSHGQGVESVWFHVVDGALKVSFFLGYVLAIGRLEDIKRVFQYHGAEHKSIHAYEAGKELTVDNAREYSTLHPRCGTAFLMVVLLVSMGTFAVLLPAVPLHATGISRTLLLVLAKIALMFPVAGISYEIIRWAGRERPSLVSPLVYPGLLMQKLTTRPPDDGQLEVALEALKLVLGKDRPSDPGTSPPGMR